MESLPTDRTARIESLVSEWLHDEEVPGASVVVFDADGDRYAEGFGARDVETNAPATPDTLYGVGSLVKPVTALAVLQHVEAGDLSLDDPVDDYVDHFAEAPGEPVTVAELLSHTSGMPATGPDRSLLSQALRGVPAGVATEADRERFVRAASEFRVTDADRFFYYNTGYNVLGRIVEALDGRDYATYVREEVLDPLGMERTTFDQAEFAADENAATGYRAGNGPPKPSPLPFEELLAPSAGLTSSARELARFFRVMLAGGGADGSRVASAETVERLQRARVTKQTFLDGTTREYGYGWMRQPLADDELVGHGGGVGVSSGFAGYLEDAGVGVAVACNTVPDVHPTDLGAAILAVVQGHAPTAVPAFALRAKCDAVTGTYESFRGRFATCVEREAGGVTLSSPEQDDGGVRAFPESLDPDDHTFFSIAEDGTRHPVEFDLDGDHDDLFFRRTRLRRTG